MVADRRLGVPNSLIPAWALHMTRLRAGRAFGPIPTFQVWKDYFYQFPDSCDGTPRSDLNKACEALDAFAEQYGYSSEYYPIGEYLTFAMTPELGRMVHKWTAQVNEYTAGSDHISDSDMETLFAVLDAVDFMFCVERGEGSTYLPLKRWEKDLGDEHLRYLIVGNLGFIISHYGKMVNFPKIVIDDYRY